MRVYKLCKYASCIYYPAPHVFITQLLMYLLPSSSCIYYPAPHLFITQLLIYLLPRSSCIYYSAPHLFITQILLYLLPSSSSIYYPAPHLFITQLFAGMPRARNLRQLQRRSQTDPSPVSWTSELQRNKSNVYFNSNYCIIEIRRFSISDFTKYCLNPYCLQFSSKHLKKHFLFA